VNRAAEVVSLSIAPVKGLGLAHPHEVYLGPHGVAENRRFYMIDEAGRRYGLARDGALVQVQAEYDAGGETLRIVFPGGRTVEGAVAAGERVVTDFYGRPVEGHIVGGPFEEALSSYARRPVRLVRAVRPGGGVDRDRSTRSRQRSTFNTPRREQATWLSSARFAPAGVRRCGQRSFDPA
jgi:uncharacterized protein YcbX